MTASQTCSLCGAPGAKTSNGVHYEANDLVPSGFSFTTIPICPRCGGLGIEFDCEDFHQKVSQIIEFKHLYHPMDGFPQPPAILRYQYLKGLIEGVEKLLSVYGPGNQYCFAGEMVESNSPDREVLEMTRLEASRILERVTSTVGDYPFAIRSLMHEANVALYSGDVNKGLRLFKVGVDMLPNDASLVHDYAVMQIRFARNIEEALSLFIRATTLEPKRSLHFYQAAHVLEVLGRGNESAIYMSHIALCPDFENFVKEIDPKKRERLIRSVSQNSQYRLN